MFDGGELSASDSEFFTSTNNNYYYFNINNNISNSIESEENNKKRRTRTRGTKKMRFSDEQIRSLEVMFESEWKLEPRKKMQLATELGLEPRQVAIWFQNKRARSKSKQLEMDYNMLVSNYNTLNSKFEDLKKENQSLILQLKKLHDIMDKSTGEEGARQQQVQAKSTDDGKSVLNGERGSCGIVVVTSDGDDSSIRADYMGVDDDQVALINGDWATSTLQSDDDDAALIRDHCNTTSTNSSSYHKWWDFWS